MMADVEDKMMTLRSVGDLSSSIMSAEAQAIFACEADLIKIKILDESL